MRVTSGAGASVVFLRLVERPQLVLPVHIGAMGRVVRHRQSDARMRKTLACWG